MSDTTRSPLIPWILTLIVAAPILGTFFPLESYLSAPTVANPNGVPVPPTLATTFTLIAMSAFIVTLSMADSRKMADALVRNWFLLALALWAIVTALWAETPSLSFNRSGRLILAILYAIYLAQVCDRKTMFRILFYATLIGIVGSVAVTVLVPSLSRVVDARGAYRGAYQHKNVLGSVAALALIFSYYSYKIQNSPRMLCIALAVMAFTLLILANSVGSMVAFLIAVSFVFYLSTFATGQSQDRLLALIVGLCAIGGVYSLFALFPDALEFTGRDFTTLTGRTDVWHFAQTLIDIKPIWGWGHGAWGSTKFSQYGLNEINWAAPNAHNAWLDLRLQLGIPGLILGILCLSIAAKRGIAAVLTCRDPEYLVWITVIVFQGIRSGTETLYVDPASIEIFWLSAAIARLGVLTARAPRRAPVAMQAGAMRHEAAPAPVLSNLSGP